MPPIGGSRTHLVFALGVVPLLALALALAPSSTAADVFSSGYPHLFYNDTGWLDGDVDLMSRFDVFTTAFWNQEGATAARLDSLALLNPEMERLAYVNAAGLSLPDVGDPNHVVNRLAAGIYSFWYVRNESGQIVYFDPNIPDMKMLNLSSKCPRVQGKTLGEYLADFTASQIMTSGHWEGLFIDNMWAGAAWVNPTIPGSLDFNMDAVPDHPDSADSWWTLGVTAFLHRLRQQLGNDVRIIGNGNGRQYLYLNGRYFEDFPFREGWTGSMQQVSDWQNAGLNPSLLALVTRGTPENYQLMRYGLCSALIGGEFAHHFAQTQALPNPTFYDEYAVDLGQPLGPPIELGITELAAADFESGWPAGFSSSCGSGQGVLTTNPSLVVDGQTSLLGRPGGTSTWQIFLCTIPNEIQLAANSTYTLSFNYRIVSEPPGDGYFFAGARSDVDINGSDRAAVIIDPPAGTLGVARGVLNLGNYPNYYLKWGLKFGGEIVIDSIRLIQGQGGAFRRDFENGIGLVNPTSSPFPVQLERAYHRIEGTVDPATNNGMTTNNVTLAAQDGLVLLNGPSTAVLSWGDPPAGAPLVLAFPNPVPAGSTSAVEIAGVPRGGSVAVVSPLGRIVRRLATAGPDGAWRWDLRSASSQRAPSGLYLLVVRDAERRQVGSTRLTIWH